MDLERVTVDELAELSEGDHTTLRFSGDKKYAGIVETVDQPSDNEVEIYLTLDDQYFAGAEVIHFIIYKVRGDALDIELHGSVTTSEVELIVD